MKIDIRFLGLTITNQTVAPVSAVVDVVPDLGEQLDSTEAKGAKLVASGDNHIAKGQALVNAGTAEKQNGQRKLDSAKTIRGALGQK